jgi:hypothetical protein
MVVAIIIRIRLARSLFTNANYNYHSVSVGFHLEFFQKSDKSVLYSNTFKRFFEYLRFKAL